MLLTLSSDSFYDDA
jgi:hypothetical protein